MMMDLSSLKNTHRPKKASKRVGRGVGSGKGKTCGRGEKGAKSRSGYKRRNGQEGGQRPVYKKIPIRGFSRGRFQEEQFEINVGTLEQCYESGEVVSLATLKEKNLISNKKTPILVILGEGDLKKALTCEVHRVSAGAKEKIESAKGTVKIL